MTTPLETIEHAGCTIKVFPDYDAESPREWENPTTMVLSHGRYDLPNEAGIDFDAYDGWDEVRRALVKDHGARIILPVYGYDHGQLAMHAGDRVGQFADPWDSGTLGFIFSTAVQIRECFMVTRITKEIEAKAIDNLRTDVETYDRWARGGFVGYVVEDERGETVDSCWGFDDEKYAIEKAKSNAEYHARAAVAKTEKAVSEALLASLGA